VGVALTPDGYRAYVSHHPDRVSVLDLRGRAVVATLTVPGFPMGLAVAPDGGRTYVTASSGSELTLIDTATDTVVGTTGPLDGSAPVAVAVAPDGRQAYVATEGTCVVEILDTESNTVVPRRRIIVGCAATDVAFAPDGRHALLVSDTLDRAAELYVIDTATQKAGPPLSVGESAYGVAVAPDGSHVFITVPRSGSLIVVPASEILPNTPPEDDA
jgi:DNA-binding beta-propeller fold protein YncE